MAEDSCQDYGYAASSTEIVQDAEGRLGIVATASALIDMDDPEEVAAAKEEAELLATRRLVDFIGNQLTNTHEVERIASATRGINASRQELATQMSRMASNSAALIKGARIIGSCYSPGDEVRISVSIQSSQRP